VFLSSEAVLGGVSLGTFIYQLAKYGAGGLSIRVPRDPAERTSFERLRVIQVGTGIMFWVVWGTGVIHAYAHQKPPVLTKPPRYEIIDDPSKIDVIDPAPQKRSSGARAPQTYVSPYVTPDGAGIALTWEF